MDWTGKVRSKDKLGVSAAAEERRHGSYVHVASKRATCKWLAGWLDRGGIYRLLNVVHREVKKATSKLWTMDYGSTAISGTRILTAYLTLHA